ncbi:MAG: hypothetical protein IIA68_07190 [Proteobacteria bacterium]|nr:hypothetical protein [Pseudomonadota bacterium]
MNMLTHKCIYCLRDLDASDFRTEHVIPQAFGTFENNLTLNESVCGECNQYFGDNLELIFARDSFEAYDRVRRVRRRRQGCRGTGAARGRPGRMTCQSICPFSPSCFSAGYS